MTFTLTPSKRRIRKALPLTRQQNYDLYIRSPERAAVLRKWKASRDNPGALVLLLAQAWVVAQTINALAFPVPSVVPYLIVVGVWLAQRHRGKAMCLAGCTGGTQQQHLSYWILNRAERKGLSMALAEDREWVAKREWRWRWLLFIALCPWHHRHADKSKHWRRLRKRAGGHLTNWGFVLVCRLRQLAVVCGSLVAVDWGTAHLVITISYR
jgi:hypothetical protein